MIELQSARPEPAFWGALIADGACLSIAFECLVNATRLAPGTDVALVLLLENLLGPTWVFLGFGDVPSAWTFGGGALLLSTLAVYEVHGGWRAAKAKGELGARGGATAGAGARAPTKNHDDGLV